MPASPRIFTSLAFVALLAALGFLFWTSGNFPESGVPSRPGIAMQRALTAPGSAGAAAAAGGDTAAPLPAARAPQGVTTAEAGRVRAAQRAFLADPARWNASQAPAVGTAAWFYYTTRQDWMDRVLRAPGYNLTTTALLQTARTQLDKTCQDLTLLTPDAAKAWRTWQSRKWDGWQQPDPDPPGPSGPKAAHPPNPATLVTEVVQECRGLIRPLLNEYEYLLDLRDVDEMPATTDGVDFVRPAADAQISRVEQELAGTVDQLQKRIRRTVQEQHLAEMQNTVK